MNRRLKLPWLFSISLVILLAGCELGNFSDDQTDDISDAYDESKKGGTQEIEYLNVAVWRTGFTAPVDVHYGFDQLIYVADSSTNTIYQLDENGKILGTYSNSKMSNPQKIGMDRQLNLFIACKYDTIFANQAGKYAAILILNMSSVKSVLSPATPILKKQVYPLFIGGFQGNATDAAKVRFTGIATFADNSYAISRLGENNSSATRPGGYDNSVVLFNKSHQYQGDLSNTLLPNGTGLSSASNPIAITSFAVPPQNQTVPQGNDFLLGLSGLNFYRVQGVRYEVTPDGITYSSETRYLSQDTTKSSRFLSSLQEKNGSLESRFTMPNDLAIARDKHQFIFVVDTELDSVFQFTYGGEEGVPVFGRKNEQVSFGGSGSGPKNLNKPRGVAYGNRKLYVADTGNRRVMVYKLSTDITGQ